MFSQVFHLLPENGSYYVYVPGSARRRVPSHSTDQSPASALPRFNDVFRYAPRVPILSVPGPCVRYSCSAPLLADLCTANFFIFVFSLQTSFFLSADQKTAQRLGCISESELANLSTGGVTFAPSPASFRV